jgi:farnesyl diphosphate synthase
MVELRARVAAVAEEVEAALDRALPEVQGPGARLHEAMRYATLGGGKRLRAFLAVASADLFDVPRARSVRVGAAIELIHAYSLAHDDLPAMDDALTRRGRPSCHRQYDEATAILAGDALQSLAFDLLVDPATHPEPSVRCALVARLAAAAGPRGMCGGQMIDLLAERRTLDLEQILELQRLKTGTLISYACETGALLGGGSDAARGALRGYAADLGLAFQIQDDLLDVTGDAEVTGKDLGRDAVAGKATVVALLGVAESRRHLAELRDSALTHLDRLEGESGVLRAVFDFVISRSS